MLGNTRQSFAERLGAMWCGFMHDEPKWPLHGQYQCGACGRVYPVQWAGDEKPQTHGVSTQSLQAAVAPLIIAVGLLLPAHVRAAETAQENSAQKAAIAFGRYISGQQETTTWDVEVVEVDAVLPGRKTQGHLRAIRRLLLGKPQYQVLDIAGDKTVRQQVILRYLSAEVEAAAVPAASVAITPDNYTFHYKGPVEIAGATAYSFSIKPRKHRAGLIRGELWIDGETGAAVSESGYLVKSPSLFVKRITLTRVSGIRDGHVQEHITHISVDSRFMGRAELTVAERPCTDPDVPAASGSQEL